MKHSALIISLIILYVASPVIGVEKKADIRLKIPELNAIGRVDALIPGKGISHGTGVLINECMVLTNRHVVEGGKTKRSEVWEAWDNRMPGDPMPTVPEYPDFVDLIGKSVKFRVGYTGDANKPFANEVDGIVIGYGAQGYPSYAHYDDWALISISKSTSKKLIDARVRPIRLIFPNVDQVKQYFNDVEIAGFPANQPEETITYHSHCKYEGGGGGVFNFKCIIIHGESGSPILGRYPDKSIRIISLAKSSIDDNFTVGINLSYIINKLKPLIETNINNLN